MNDPETDRTFAFPHHAVYELGNHHAVVFWIGGYAPVNGLFLASHFYLSKP
jgi:hypothetical protein